MPAAKKLSVFGNSQAPVGLTKFAETPLEDQEFHNITLKEEHGTVAIVTVTDFDPAVKTTNFGVKPAVKASLKVLRKSGETETYEDQLLFGKAVVDQLKGFIGQTIAAKVSVQKSNYGTDFPKFVEPTDDEVAAVEAAFAEAPF